jgi:hypothetical protein
MSRVDDVAEGITGAIPSQIAAHASAANPHPIYVLGSIYTTQGDLISINGSGTLARLGVGSNGTLLVADNTQPIGFRWTTNINIAGNAVSHVATNAQAGATYTLQYSDDGVIVEVSNSAIITIPAIATMIGGSFTQGTQITILQIGTGTVYINGGSGVTLTGTPQVGTNSVKLRAQWSACTLIKRAGTDVWVAVGDLSL